MKKLSVLLVILVFFMLGCKQPTNIAYTLANNDSAFWNLLSKDKSYISGSYLFYKSGVCDYYHYKGGVRSKMYDDDVVYPHTWKLMGDTLLSINGFNWRVLQITSDTMVLKYWNKNDTLILIKGK